MNSLLKEQNTAQRSELTVERFFAHLPKICATIMCTDTKEPLIPIID